jgi:hypothetical protein
VSAATAPASTSLALSLHQHKAALWTDDRLQVYAVAMGTRIQNLAATLASAEVADFDCLLPGALSDETQRTAPYLVQLKRESAFTDWLLFEAAAGLGEWGVLVRSAGKMLALRGHLRSLLRAQTPVGQTIELDWMDPTILKALLPLFEPAALTGFMGPMESLVIPEVAAWTTARVVLGRLELRIVPVAKSG